MFKLRSNKMKYKIPRRVKLQIHDDDALRKDRQDCAFYVWGDTSSVATLSYKDQELTLVCVGEMRIHYREEVIRYTDRLIQAGIKNDKDLAKIEAEGGEWINNSWFEVYDENAHIYTDDIFHEVKDAIESIAVRLKDDGVQISSTDDAVRDFSTNDKWWQKITKGRKYE